jgi:hypothetical protein
VSAAFLNVHSLITVGCCSTISASSGHVGKQNVLAQIRAAGCVHDSQKFEQLELKIAVSNFSKSSMPQKSISFKAFYGEKNGVFSDLLLISMENYFFMAPFLCILGGKAPRRLTGVRWRETISRRVFPVFYWTSGSHI